MNSTHQTHETPKPADAIAQSGATSHSAAAETRPKRLSSFVVTALLIAGLSYWLGERGTFRPTLSSSSLARVGVALEQPTLHGSSREWASLAHDVRQLREMVDGDEQTAFDLVVALRGLLDQGHPDWERAGRLCERLKWSRCDREALEAIERRTHP